MRPFAPLAAAALAALAPAASAAEPAAMPEGAYEVVYKLELRHLALRDEGAATVCLSGVEATAFPVLSPNNPLARCPAQGIRRDGDQISFEIVCPGGNAAKAEALFELRKDGFQGRITMTMGGKNMTMAEIQRGRRIGDCAPTEPASP